MSLTKKTLKNISAVGLFQVFGKILNLVTLIILARLLSPSDFGIVAIAGILITLVDGLKDFGMSSAVIQRKENVEKSLRTGFSIRLIMSILLFCVVYIVAPLWANFFKDQVISSILKISAIVIIIENFNFIPNTKLTKELRFEKIVISGFLGNISYSAVAIFMAYNGYSFWSLVYGRIIQGVVSSIIFWIINPWKFHLQLDKKIAKELFNYGKYVMATGFIILAFDNLIYTVLGKLIGPTVVGYYIIAYTWATFSSRQIVVIFDKVLFSTFSNISNDIPRLGNAFLKTLKYTSIITIPITLGIFALAPEFVKIVLGEKWAPAILPLQILCIAGLVYSLSSATSSLYLSMGKPNISTILVGMQLFLIILFIIPAAKIFGLIGVASLVSLSGLIFAPISFSLAVKFLGIEGKSFVKILIPPLFSAILMAIFIIGIKEYTKMYDIISKYPLLYLIFLVLSGIIMYVLILFILTNGRLKEDIRMLYSNLIS